tara:strand:- start:4776 stop:5294 length:519 start_codon:yes stop_codon:yes gene_type:complete
MISEKYNEPNFELIQKNNNIEIRQYGENIIAKTSLKNGDINQNSSMFRTLADYIFGNNTQSKKIPMTTPVMTRYDNSSYDMIFFMLDTKEIKDLPEPVNQDVVIEKVSLNKVVVIQFSWWASEKNITKHESILREYIVENNLEVTSSLMVAQYDPPFTLPNFRRNELMYQIK